MPQVMVISSEGFFYSYSIDLENGGECTLMKQYRLVSLSFPICFLNISLTFFVFSLLDSVDEGGGGIAD